MPGLKRKMKQTIVCARPHDDSRNSPLFNWLVSRRLQPHATRIWSEGTAREIPFHIFPHKPLSNRHIRRCLAIFHALSCRIALAGDVLLANKGHTCYNDIKKLVCPILLPLYQAHWFDKRAHKPVRLVHHFGPYRNGLRICIAACVAWFFVHAAALAEEEAHCRDKARSRRCRADPSELLARSTRKSRTGAVQDERGIPAATDGSGEVGTGACRPAIHVLPAQANQPKDSRRAGQTPGNGCDGARKSPREGKGSDRGTSDRYSPRRRINRSGARNPGHI